MKSKYLVKLPEKKYGICVCDCMPCQLGHCINCELGNQKSRQYGDLCHQPIRCEDEKK